jgi:hypothetical protein
LRKLAAALLALPVLALIYVPVVLRRSIASRIAVALGVGTLVAVGAFGLVRPSTTTATPPLPPIVPLGDDAFSASIAAGTELTAPVSITFSAPMDRRSVEAALDVEPVAAVQLEWNADSTRLTVRPQAGWASSTYHTITVRPGALGESGRPMAVPARAVFMTRGATTGSIAATALAGAVAKVTTAFTLTFDHPVAIGDVRRALAFDPPLNGALDIAPATAAGQSVFVFTPSDTLAPSTTYTIGLSGLVDAAGAAVEAGAPLTVTTSAAPKVVRFRPLHGTTNVEQSAVLSVRFTEPMDRASTKSAFVVSIGGKAIGGTVSFAEKDTVLVFRPSDALPYGASVELLVKDTALSATGVPLAAASSVRIAVEPKPAPRSSGGSSPVGSGGAVGGGSWGAVETYYLNLMNCTRTGGWVT